MKLMQSLIIALMLLALQTPAQAGMIGTGQLLDEVARSDDLLSARKAIEKQLVELGVAADAARERVASLSDAQVAEITQKLDKLPAGGDTAGVLLALFVIFVITDVIGATDIFPFIHPVNSK